MENIGKYRFYHPIRVRYADTDAQGHVFFGNYLTFFDEAFSGYFRTIGFAWTNLADMGLDTYHVSVHCDYKGSALFEDILHVHARISRIGKSSFTLDCAIYKKDSDELIASGYITAVIVNPETRKPARVPDEIRDAVATYEGKKGQESELR
jgi:acyl-CoA thioester hydrolase